MDIVIDLTAFYEFLNLPPDVMLWRLFWTIGWLPIALVFLYGFWEIWLNYISDKWGSQQKFVFLAIDIPRNNQQSPKAVENLFTYLAGAHSTLNVLDQYWEGKFQLTFSFEIVSIEGYTQFLIRTPEGFRNLVESAIYSQYPDAEITEVNDYTKGIPTKYPNDEYDIWGSEFIQNRSSAYPIKTWKDFEHQMGEPVTHFRDPMATLMDLCSSLKAGEQLWFQMIVKPIGFDWPSVADAEIAKIFKEKPKGKVTLINKLLDGFTKIVDDVFGTALTISSEAKKEEAVKMMDLRPMDKRKVEAIHEKVSKLGFDAKLRVLYVAKKEVKNNPKVVNGFVGYIKQFSYNDLNNLKPDMNVTATSTAFFFKNKRLIERKNKIIQNYINRSGNGRKFGTYNIEELATLWHFPVEGVVKAPMIQKAPGRKAEPPMSLPIGEEVRPSELPDSIFNLDEEDIFKPSKKEETPPQEEKKIEEISGEPPENLPFV